MHTRAPPPYAPASPVRPAGGGGGGAAEADGGGERVALLHAAEAAEAAEEEPQLPPLFPLLTRGVDGYMIRTRTIAANE